MKNKTKNTKSPQNVQTLESEISNKVKSSLLLINIQGIIPGTRRDKLQVISSLAEELESDLILITETHLKPEIGDEEIQIGGWDCIRSDRTRRQKGGSMIYYKEDMIILNSNDYMEVSMFFAPRENKAIICCYRPPNCPTVNFKEVIDVMEDWIKSVEKEHLKAPQIVIAGDFNFPDLKSWSEEDIENYSSNPIARDHHGIAVGSDKDQALDMIELIKKLGLTQEVRDITHGKNILDLIFTSDPDQIEEVEIISNAKVSDHNFVVAFSESNASKRKEDLKKNFCSTVIPKYNIKRADIDSWKKAREQMEEYETNENESVQVQMDNLINKIENIVKDNFKLNTPPNRSGQKSKSYIPKEAKRLMKLKMRASRSLKNTIDEKKKKDLK